MKVETMTVKACEVQVGDVIGGRPVLHVKHYDTTTTMDFNGYWDVINLPNAVRIEVSRPIPDPCPRGRMTLDEHNRLEINGCVLHGYTKEYHLAALWKIVKLWNEHEDRTTAEIEANTK